MKQLSLAVMICAALSAPVVADQSPKAIVDDLGLLRYDFRSALKPTLNCPVLHVCDIVLEPGEVVTSIAIGDSVRWKRDVGSSGKTIVTQDVLVKPTDVGLSTNMVIDTDRRRYTINLVSSSKGFVSQFGFYNYYDAATLAAARAVVAAATPPPELPVMDPYRFHYGYSFSGKEPFQPIRAYNDGQHTFIEFPAAIPEAPVVKSINDRGGYETINYRVKDVVVVAISGVPHVFEVRGDGRDPAMEAAIKDLGVDTSLEQKEKLYVIDGVPKTIAVFLGEGRGRELVTVTHNGG